MKILVLNCGSSSIKFQLWDMLSKQSLATGVAEKVGLKGSFVKLQKGDEEKVIFEGEIIDHQTGIEYILGILTSKKYGLIRTLSEIDAVGHRVTHGGEYFNKSVFITQEVIDRIEECSDLAPLHNPANLKGIMAMSDLIPGINQVAVFDTAFHQTMDESSYMYAIPYSLYKKHKIRRYGFHGTSHAYVSQKACDSLGVDIKTQKIITCHLGNGASVCAIKNGKSVDTSMGFTPIEGLIMGSRCGDLDLGVVNFIMDKESVERSSLNTVFNKRSGMLGISGVSSDMREIQAAAWEEKNERAQLALDMYYYRIKKYIGAYTAALGGVDIIVFAGGIGENGPVTRAKSLEGLEYLGLQLDEKRNEVRGEEQIISSEDSKVKVIIVPTDEELVIAEDTYNILSNMDK